MHIYRPLDLAERGSDGLDLFALRVGGIDRDVEILEPGCGGDLSLARGVERLVGLALPTQVDDGVETFRLEVAQIVFRGLTADRKLFADFSFFHLRTTPILDRTWDFQRHTGIV